MRESQSGTQRRGDRSGPEPLALYVHIPFCVRKCPYCDFNSGPVGEQKRARHLSALETEIRTSPWKGSEARTVFFGGGTPSELTLTELRRIVKALRDTFDLSRLEEWTIECNPGTLDDRKVSGFAEMGFDRISLGVQSFQHRHLEALGRCHDADQSRDAVKLARQAGFDNLNLDLIFALSGQTIDEWDRDLEEALSLDPEHLSLYNLTIEPGTEYGRRHRRGELPLPEEEAAALMYEKAMEATSGAGLEQYEISNYARPGRRCRHNLVYWSNQPYLGFGVSAASYVDGVRWVNCADWTRYESSVDRGQASRETEEKLSPPHALGEEIMLGLRTNEGLQLKAASRRHGLDADELFADELRFLTGEKLVQESEGWLRLTARGRLVADAVCAEFLRHA